MSRRCCCDRPCIIFEDDFNRANSTDLGSNLIEVAQNSDILSNTLRIPANGILLGSKKHPINTPTGFASVELFNLQSGEIRRVLINSTINASSYLYGEIETTDENSAVLRVGSSVGGTLHELTGLTYTEGEAPFLVACRTLTGISASFGDDPGFVFDCQEWNGGRYAGMMNAGTGPVQFDNYKFAEHSYTLPDKGCATCFCECGGIPPHKVGVCMPKVLKLVFLASGSCDCLNNACITLTYDQTTPSIISWRSPITPVPELCDWTGEGTNFWEFKLFCDPQTPVLGKSFLLCVKNISSTLCDPDPDGWGSAGTDCWNGFASEAVHASSFTCDPLEISVPLFTCTGTPPDPPSCTYTVVILEGSC